MLDMSREGEQELAALLKQVGGLRHFRRGEVIFWQGYPAEFALIIRKGRIKIFTLSVDGRVHINGILGRGRLVGASECILGGEFESSAEVMDEVEAYVIEQADLQRLLALNANFSRVVLQELALTTRSLGRQLHQMSLMEVPERIKTSLLALAEEHGVPAEEGIRIDLNVTHAELAEMVSASRSTVSAQLGELERQGYIWKDGRRLGIIPPDQFDMLDHLAAAIKTGASDEAVRWTNTSVARGADLLKLLDALASAMRQVATGHAGGDVPLTDVLMSTYAMEQALSIVHSAMRQNGIVRPSLGTILIGTVRGDIHDIGKNIVAELLAAHGYELIDLGVDVSPERFVLAAQEHHPQLIAMSCLMTTTMLNQEAVVQAIIEAGLRDSVKIIVGGAPISQDFAEHIGADGFSTSARGALALAARLIDSA